MKAEAELGTKIADVVVTVSAYLSDSQRQTTDDAGSITGLKVLRIVNVTMPAAIAHRSERKESASSTC